MRFLFVYELGETPECRDVKDFPDEEAAKAHARESLEDTLKSSSAKSASIRVGQLEDDEDENVRWLGAYDMTRDAEPAWLAQ